MKAYNNWCILALGILLIPYWISAQAEVSGRWDGFVVQQNGQDTFRYVIDWQKNGEAIRGTASSTSIDGSVSASFEIAGRWQEQNLHIQEVRQIHPASPQWCLKNINLSEQQGQKYSLQGKWTAQGCRPGLVYLRPTSQTQLPRDHTVHGHWVGQLLQSDRDYGFYFTLDLFPDGRGKSYIVSEGAGGEATHSFNWYEAEGMIRIEEEKVIKRSEENWPWCIKSLRLHRTKGKLKDRLEGNWDGYIEFKDPATARCASGQTVLEKIHPKPVPTSLQDSLVVQYEGSLGRKVKIDQLIELANRDVRMRVWDNGTVDGDRVTLFLNGKRILHNFRVSKRKWSQTVRLHEGENMLILHAEDLGSILPNTVAVSLDDGKREQVIILNSNLRESGGILMQPFVYKE